MTALAVGTRVRIVSPWKSTVYDGRVGKLTEEPTPGIWAVWLDPRYPGDRRLFTVQADYLEVVEDGDAAANG